MSGEKESHPAEKRKSELEIALDNYENEMHFGAVHPHNDIEDYLTMSRADISALTADDAGEIGFMLAQYSFYIQKTVNRHQAMMNWAEANIKTIVARTIDQYNAPYSTFEEKKMKAIAGNDAAMVFQQFIVEAKKRIDTLSYLSQKIESMSRAMLEIQQTKRKSNV